MKSLVLLAVFLLSPLAFADDDIEFKLPSFVSVQAGGSNQKSRNGSIQVGLSLPHNWQLSFGGDGGSSPSEEDGKVLRTRGINASIESDPLATLSGLIGADSWHIEDQVSAVGGRASGLFAWRDWNFGLEGGGQTIEFKKLPPILWPGGTSQVSDQWAGGSIETFLLRPVTIRVHASFHRYNKDLTDYTEGLRVLRISPAVLTTASALNQSEGSLTVTYARHKWSAGVQAGASRSALDGVRTGMLGALGTYRISSSWSTNASLTLYRPQNAEENSGATVSSNLGFTYSW